MLFRSVAREDELTVWRVKPDSTVESVRVKAAAREGESVGISEGLAAGDRVVTAGTQKLTAGAKVAEAAGTEAAAGTTK